MTSLSGNHLLPTAGFFHNSIASFKVLTPITTKFLVLVTACTPYLKGQNAKAMKLNNGLFFHTCLVTNVMLLFNENGLCHFI